MHSLFALLVRFVHFQLPPDEQNSISSIVGLLETMGPRLGAPYSSAIVGSRYGHMRELRIQHGGRPFRVLYAFDPRRIAILLLGGDKTGDQRGELEITARFPDGEIRLDQWQPASLHG